MQVNHVTQRDVVIGGGVEMPILLLFLMCFYFQITSLKGEMQAFFCVCVFIQDFSEEEEVQICNRFVLMRVPTISHKPLSDTYCKLQYFLRDVPDSFPNSLPSFILSPPPPGFNFYTTAVKLFLLTLFVVCRLLVFPFCHSLFLFSFFQLKAIQYHICSLSAHFLDSPRCS